MLDLCSCTDNTAAESYLSDMIARNDCRSYVKGAARRGGSGSAAEYIS